VKAGGDKDLLAMEAEKEMSPKNFRAKRVTGGARGVIRSAVSLIDKGREGKDGWHDTSLPERSNLSGKSFLTGRQRHL